MPDDKVLVYLPANFSPVTILQMRNHIEFEQIIEDWQRDSLEKKYVKVDRLGGPGDKSRDIICIDHDNQLWIYQCKHYKDKLTKEQTFPEIAKCCYFCYKGEYKIQGESKIPKRYFFMSPMGLTTSMKDLFDDPKQLKSELKHDWNKLCRKKISDTNEIVLEGDFELFIDRLDFSTFYFITPEDFIDDFRKSAKFDKWFGTFVRPKKLVVVPEEIQIIESVYIKKILDAYSEHLGKNIDHINKLRENGELLKNFEDQRRYFYSAEFLAAVARDSHPAEFQWFDHLKKEFYEGIIEAIDEDAENGFIRLKNVLKRAAIINIDSKNPLTRELDMDKRKGMCHELANERDEIKWTKKSK